MPELAEVEYFRKMWEKAAGAKILCIHQHSRKRIFQGCDVRQLRNALTGSRLVESATSGKQMLFRFDSPAWLGLHLGMTGELSCQPATFKPGKHDHLVLFTREHAFVFSDPRQFGRIRFDHGVEPPGWWNQRPADILSQSFTCSYMNSRIGSSMRPVKAALLDQSIFPGIGNWMADEILWRARIRPDRPWSGLTEAEKREVWKRVRQVCRDALRVIAPDWSTPPDTWLFNHRWKDGGTCPKTGKPLVRQQIAGRTTCYSPAWQR